jgi:peptidoglycan hydrolase-like protein with peptidoglycan-binding domain
MRRFSLFAGMLAMCLSAGALSAQSTSTQQPASKPTMKQQSSVHATQDTSKAATKTAAKSSSMKTRHAAWTKDQIKEAQEGLSKAGLYKGKATGVMNADTRAALRSYQKKNNLQVTGRLSDSVLVKLKST